MQLVFVICRRRSATYPPLCLHTNLSCSFCVVAETNGLDHCATMCRDVGTTGQSTSLDGSLDN